MSADYTEKNSQNLPSNSTDAANNGVLPAFAPSSISLHTTGLHASTPSSSQASATLKTDSHSPQKKKDFLERKDRQMFMELGMLATTNFLPWEAHALFGQLLYADHLAAYPRIGLAHCKIIGGQFQEAHKLLQEEVVTSSPLSAYGVALRLLALHLAKQPKELDKLLKESQELLESNPPAFQFLKNLLEIPINS